MNAEQVTKENPMRVPFIEKIVLSAGATGTDLEKAKKLLKLISGVEPQVIASTKRIPDFGVRPGLEVGTRVTLRGEEALKLLTRLLGSIDNTVSKRAVSPNHFSFGVKEYIEIPGMEYQRDIGIKGLNVTVVLARKGLRVKRKKIKSGNVPAKQHIPKEEVVKYMEDVFKTRFVK